MRDAESFDEFYRGTSARLMRYGYAIVGDLTEAQDVVQEAYTRAWQRWRTVAAHPAPEAWVRLTVARLAADRWRRLTRWQAFMRRSGPPDHVHPPGEDTVVVLAALRRLPMAQRQAMALYYLFDLPVADIAAETGVPTGTVTSWLSRGRAGLAAALADEPTHEAKNEPPHQASNGPTHQAGNGPTREARRAPVRRATVWEGIDNE